MDHGPNDQPPRNHGWHEYAGGEAWSYIDPDGKWAGTVTKHNGRWHAISDGIQDVNQGPEILDTLDDAKMVVEASQPVAKAFPHPLPPEQQKVLDDIGEKATRSLHTGEPYGSARDHAPMSWWGLAGWGAAILLALYVILPIG
ncbi:MAG: hypothetical protein WBF53_11530 [Litorimonas sp.]